MQQPGKLVSDIEYEEDIDKIINIIKGEEDDDE